MLNSLFKTDTRSQADIRRQFEELMHKSYRQAYHLAYRLCGNATEAEDLVQESFVRAFRFFHRYDPTLSFTSWLYRIITNVHIDSVRKNSRFRTASLDATPENGAAWEIADEESSPERLLLVDEMSEPLQMALKAMTPEFRVAVLLADVECMAYEEIAEIMNISVGTVRSRIHRGRKQLRDRLESRMGVLL